MSHAPRIRSSAAAASSSMWAVLSPSKITTTQRDTLACGATSPTSRPRPPQVCEREGAGYDSIQYWEHCEGCLCDFELMFTSFTGSGVCPQGLEFRTGEPSVCPSSVDQSTRILYDRLSPATCRLSSVMCSCPELRTCA
eukprot:5318232-Prymnesium_polylepis.2